LIVGAGNGNGNGDANMCEEPVDQYLRSFQWNKVKYRADKSIADLIDALQKVHLHTTLSFQLTLAKTISHRKSPA
jgi:hypothetical protein